MPHTHRHPAHIRPFARGFWLNLLTFAATGAVVSIFFQKNYGSCGDYPQHFNGCHWGIGIGAALGLAFHLLHARIPYGQYLSRLPVDFLRYFLAWTMLTYGIVKIIPVQFPHLLANMDSTFHELTPMRVAWAFFGYSKGFQMLMGWAETLPALLLLFRRTWLLGALLMMPVLVNVVALNIFFDVCVKLNASIYLGVAVCLALTQADRLWTFFFTDRSTPPSATPELFRNRTARRAALVLNVLLIVAILTDTANQGWQAFDRYQRQEARTAVHGIWDMEKMERLQGTEWMVVPGDDSIYVARLYLQGEQGVLKGPHRRDRVIIDLDTIGQQLNMTFLNLRNERPFVRVWRYTRPDTVRISFTGMLGADSVRMVLRDGQTGKNE